MKPRFLIAAIVSLCTRLLAQTYIPIPDSNAIWMQGMALYNAYSSHAGATCDGPLSFGTDTVINTKTYHRLYGQMVCNWINVYTSVPPPGTVVSGTDYYPVELRYIFRQDTAQRKVYLYNLTNHVDTLLYDFGNLVVGQSCPDTYSSPALLGLTVISQSTISLGSNSHRVWQLGTSTTPDVAKLIEGVGSTQGFGTQLIIPFESMGYLHCFTREGAQLLSNWPGSFMGINFPSVGVCDQTLNIHEQENIHIQVLLFPNPATEQLRIQSSVPMVRYQIMDLSSREFLSETFDAVSDKAIPLASLPSGSFLIKLRTSMGYDVTRLFFKL